MFVEILTTLAIFASCGAEEPFDDLLPNSDICGSNCTDKYLPFELLDECQRGCRFHVIAEFFLSDGNLTQVNDGCYGSCVEAYSETSVLTDACKHGCDFQQKVFEASKEKEDEGPSIHLLSPLMQVRAVYSSFVGAIQVIRTTLVTYFISDDDTIVAVAAEPEIVIGINPDGVEGMEDDNLLPAQQQSRDLSMDSENEEPSVVKCLTRQVGVPRYVLGASVIAIIVFCMYIMVAFFHARSSKARAYSREKNMQINPLPLPVKLVRPEDLTKLSFAEEEEGDAPPLPAKVKLPDTLI